MHEPAHIGGQLLGLWTWQQHAIIESVQEPALRNPALLLDQDPVHHGDLPGRPPETERRHPQPDPEGLRKERRRGPGAWHRPARAGAVSRSCGRLSRGPIMGFAPGVPAPPIEGVVEDHAGIELCQIVGEDAGQAQRRGEQAGSIGRKFKDVCSSEAPRTERRPRDRASAKGSWTRCFGMAPHEETTIRSEEAKLAHWPKSIECGAATPRGMSWPELRCGPRIEGGRDERAGSAVPSPAEPLRRPGRS